MTELCVGVPTGEHSWELKTMKKSHEERDGCENVRRMDVFVECAHILE